MFKAMVSQFGITVSEYSIEGDWIQDVANYPLEKDVNWTLFQLSNLLWDYQWDASAGPWGVTITGGSANLTVPVMKSK